MTRTSRKSILAAFALAATGSFVAPPAWPAETFRVAQVEMDMRPSTQLSDQELKTRMKVLRKLAKQPQAEGQPDYQSMFKADRRELKNRNQKAQASEPVQQEQTQDQAGKPEKKKKKQPQAAEPAQQEQTLDQTAKPAKKQKKQPQAAKPVQQEKAKTTNDPKPSITPDMVTGDQRPAAELTDADLRKRIRAAREIIKDESTTKDQRSVLNAKRKADAAELNARIAASTGVTVQPDQLQAEVSKLVGDKRSAQDLEDKQLRARIKQTRGLLAAEGLDDELSTQLRAMLTSDKQEIRKRVAARDAQKAASAPTDEADAGKSNDLPAAKAGSLTVSDLNGDRRPASDLTTGALKKRIDANRSALGSGVLSAQDRSAIENRLVSDRTEMRSRLVARRKKRSKKRLSTGATIAIAAGVGLVAGAIIASRPNIAVAEVYDDELEQWLVAPPLVKVQPRYRVEDFRTQPRLRYTVPGIEVDTVRFGFGEGFLREEEVPELERIGEVVERIVASNPNEVFLIEGHTDAVGTAEANQALSVERANAVRNALIQFFSIEDKNLAVVGYGETYLKIPTQSPEVENRRVTLRRITPLLRQSSAQ